jgi:putative transposase
MGGQHDRNEGSTWSGISRHVNRYQETPFAGARKLIKELEKHGYKLNMKRLRRLMAIQGWRTLYQEPSTTVSDPTKYKYPYLLMELKM